MTFERMVVIRSFLLMGGIVHLYTSSKLQWEPLTVNYGIGPAFYFQLK